MDVMENIGTVLGVVTGLISVVAFFAGLWTARSGNQRELRERLRQQLRGMEIACILYFQREGSDAIREAPKFSYQALDHIHDDGLISPSRTHIRYLKHVLRDVQGRQSLRLPEIALDPKTTASLYAENQRRLKVAFEKLDEASHRYVRAIGKMDNAGLGGYFVYLRYRFLPARPYENGPVAQQDSVEE